MTARIVSGAQRHWRGTRRGPFKVRRPKVEKGGYSGTKHKGPYNVLADRVRSDWRWLNKKPVKLLAARKGRSMPKLIVNPDGADYGQIPTARYLRVRRERARNKRRRASRKANRV
jgi:hypothetical protein